MTDDPPRIICSTGTVTHRALLEDNSLLIKLIGRIESDDFEFILYPIWYDGLERLLDGLRSTGRRFPLVHSEKMIGSAFSAGDPALTADGLARLEIACRAAETLGSERVVLHLWDLPDSDDKLENNIAALPACLDIARRYGVTLSVETIPCRNNEPLDIMLRLESDFPELGFTADTQHLGFHGQNELLLDPAMERLWERPGAPLHFHIRDYAGSPGNMETFRRSLHPGEGEIDLPGIFAHIKKSGRGHPVTLEASGLTPEKTVDISKINKSLNYLRELAGTA